MLLYRRIIAVSLFAWLPLAVLAILEGLGRAGSVAIPFLWDIDVHVRFLVATPLLIVAELVVHQRMRAIVKQFLERHLIPDNARAQFDAAIASAFRLRNSVLAEVLLLIFVYGVGILILWPRYMAIDTATWYATPSADGLKFSFAGMWLTCVSLPVFQFLLLRWYFRLFIWLRFLWHVSRIRLSLIPIHPDRTGGLGFLSQTAYAFIPLVAAHGALLAGNLANRIFFMGASLPQFKLEILLLVIFLVCMVQCPLLVFASQLACAKRLGLREYDALANRYVREFDTKWLRGGAPADEPLVGSGDIQSLADLGNSLEVIRTMRIVPVSRDAILQLAAATVVPILPLMLTMMPLEDLLNKLFNILF
jgi:hypothetical protein